jgi:hypothetical protein
MATAPTKPGASMSFCDQLSRDARVRARTIVDVLPREGLAIKRKTSFVIDLQLPDVSLFPEYAAELTKS